MKSKHVVQNFYHPLIIFALLTSLSIVSCSIFSVSRPEQQEYPEVMGEFPLKKIWSFDARNKIMTTPVIGEGKVFFVLKIPFMQSMNCAENLFGVLHYQRGLMHLRRLFQMVLSSHHIKAV